MSINLRWTVNGVFPVYLFRFVLGTDVYIVKRYDFSASNWRECERANVLNVST